MLDAASILAQAFEHRDRIRRIARRYLSREARQVFDSEDLEATVYRRILESGAEAASESQTWELIRAIATNAALDQTRRGFVRRRPPAPDAGDAEPHEPVPLAPILARLPAADLRQIVAFRARGISFRVIARTMGVGERTVYRRWEEARARLREGGYDLDD